VRASYVFLTFTASVCDSLILYLDCFYFVYHFQEISLQIHTYILQICNVNSIRPCWWWLICSYQYFHKMFLCL